MTHTEHRNRVAGITIDHMHSRDLDDAFWLEGTSENGVLSISIVDAAHFVKKGSDMDALAFKHGRTHYVGTRQKTPMLPRQLSSMSASLYPHVERPAITISIPITNGTAGISTISRTFLTSRARFAHGHIDGILSQPAHAYHAMIASCVDLSRSLFLSRQQHGAITLLDEVHRMLTAEDGRLMQIGEHESFAAYLMVQEFMILGNEIVATLFHAHGAPAIFRNHQARTQSTAWPMTHHTDTQTFDVQWRRSFEPAYYGAKASRHAGLNLPYYLHFTSPLRRYADLANHRILVSLLDGEDHPYSHDELSGIADHLNAVDRVSAFVNHASRRNTRVSR